MLAAIITEPGFETAELAGFSQMLDAGEYRIFCLPENERCEPGAYLDLLLAPLERLNPDVVIMPELPSLSGIAPAIAVRLGMKCITAVQGINCSGAALKLLRGVLGGKAVMEITPEFPSVITVMPAAFEKPLLTQPSDSSVTYLSLAPAGSLEGDCSQSVKMRNLGVIEQETQSSGLPITEAEVIVAAGRGIKKQENLELIRGLAGLFKHSAVAGSRAVVDSGWLPYSAQVGLTGKTVTPRAYIACGISGSPQHIAGMKNSHLIVAINKDPNAAIFNYAHYCIVEDLQDFLPVLIESLKKE
jgi:electron transfer flavoprotein alpha subunit